MSHRSRVPLWIVLYGVAILCARATGQESRWEGAIQAFEAQDREAPPPQHGVLFVGSSATALGVPGDLRLGLWGHSRGGLVTILRALEDPDIAALTTWSALAAPRPYTERQKKKWRETGELGFTDYASGTSLALGVGLLDDMETNQARYAVGDRAEQLTMPHLVVHGEHDPTVPVADSYKFYDTPSIKADKKLLRLLTGHTYGYDNGHIASDALDNAIKATVEWYETYLRAPAAAAE